MLALDVRELHLEIEKKRQIVQLGPLNLPALLREDGVSLCDVPHAHATTKPFHRPLERVSDFMKRKGFNA